MNDPYRRAVFAVIITTALGAVSAPGEAQVQSPLFDKFSVKAEFSWVALSTEIRLDSDLVQGSGTTLNFEDDLGLGNKKSIPTFDFDWQIGRRSKLAGRYQNIGRDSNAQALTDIEWGDDTIPVSADISLGFDITQFFVDYAYYPWIKDRWAAGFGLGVRWMEIGATLTWDFGSIEEQGSSDVKGTGPLPYLYFEYRRMLSDNWRFISGFGWLYVKIGDIEGGQWIGRATFEYLLGKRWAIGAGLNLSQIDVDWYGLEDADGDSHLTGAVEMDINDVSIFARLRF